MPEVSRDARSLTGPIDSAVVEELRIELADDDLLREIIDTFLDDCAWRVDQMVHAAKRQDGAGVRAQAHALKGSAGTMGALELSRLCRELEQPGGGGSFEVTAALVGQVVREHRQVDSALRRVRQG